MMSNSDPSTLFAGPTCTGHGVGPTCTGHGVGLTSVGDVVGSTSVCDVVGPTSVGDVVEPTCTGHGGLKPALREPRMFHTSGQFWEVRNDQQRITASPQ